MYFKNTIPIISTETTPPPFLPNHEMVKVHYSTGSLFTTRRKMIKRTLILISNPCFQQQRRLFKNYTQSIPTGVGSTFQFLVFFIEPEYLTLFNCLSSALLMKNKNLSDEVLKTMWYPIPLVCQKLVYMCFAQYQRSCWRQ